MDIGSRLEMGMHLVLGIILVTLGILGKDLYYWMSSLGELGKC